MLSKLAFRNVRKTVRDYGVYLITMISCHSTDVCLSFYDVFASDQKTWLRWRSYGGDDRDCSGNLSSSLSPGLYAILWRL